MTAGLVVSVYSLRSSIDPGLGIEGSRRTAIVTAAESVGAATVSISVSHADEGDSGAYSGSEFFDLFLRGYYPDRTRESLFEAGSGFIIDSDGYILTNDHVIRGCSEVVVVLSDGREFEGRVLGADPRYDLAVIKIDGTNLPVARLGDSNDVMIGEWVVAIGNPFGYLLRAPEPTVTAGVVSALHRDVQPRASGAIYKNMIQTDASINEGNSGGPLVNGRGEVIGINSFALFSADHAYMGMSFAIPINTARFLVDELIQYGRVRDIWVGMGLRNVSSSVARALALPSDEGAFIATVEPESPADRAGLRPGDVVVGINGTPTTDAQEVWAAFYGARVGDRIIIEAVRKGRLREFEMKLEEVSR
ncbi:trypsin-like peptidase domain-containing protein [bacterium]|nr:trypsin-like peptidase domain-containing protein [bacterium]